MAMESILNPAQWVEDQPSEAALQDRAGWKAVLMAVLLTLFLGGTMPFLSYFFRASTWLVWLVLWFLLLRLAKELPMGRLMRPLWPYFAWLVFYLIWGLIVSPINDVAFAGRQLVTTVTLGASMAVCLARPASLRWLASLAQFAPVLNILVLLGILYSGSFQALISAAGGQAGGFIFGLDRFGGLWGNPNTAGYICIVVLILSVLAVPWAAWLGRLSCLPLLYLSESRKSAVLTLCILLLYLVMVQGRNPRVWLAGACVTLAVVLVLPLTGGLGPLLQAASNNPAIARMMDLEERDTSERGGETRLDLLHEWETKLGQEPWYGYGLEAMSGDIPDPDDPNKIAVKGLFPLGTHNTYLGVWVEDGPIGFAAFMLMLIHYSRMCLVARSGAVGRWVVISFLLCNLVYLVLSHTHLFSMEDKTAFTLFFLLPTCMGLRDQGSRSSAPGAWAEA